MQTLRVQSLYIKYIHYIPHKISLRKNKWRDVFIENSLLPTNLCQRTDVDYRIQIWRTTQPSRRQGNFCPYVRVWSWPMRKSSNLYYRHTRNSDTITPVFSCLTLSKNAARVRQLRMRAILPLYTSAARAQNHRFEVGRELMTSRQRFGGTRARWVWRGGITLGICSCSTRTKWCLSGISNGSNNLNWNWGYFGQAQHGEWFLLSWEATLTVSVFKR